jgi:hypothetical protein
MPDGNPGASPSPGEEARRRARLESGAAASRAQAGPPRGPAAAQGGAGGTPPRFSSGQYAGQDLPGAGKNWTQADERRLRGESSSGHGQELRTRTGLPSPGGGPASPMSGRARAAQAAAAKLRQGDVIGAITGGFSAWADPTLFFTVLADFSPFSVVGLNLEAYMGGWERWGREEDGSLKRVALIAVNVVVALALVMFAALLLLLMCLYDDQCRAGVLPWYLSAAVGFNLWWLGL